MQMPKNFTSGLIVSAAVLALTVFGFRTIWQPASASSGDAGRSEGATRKSLSPSYREVHQVRLPALRKIRGIAVGPEGRLYVAGETTLAVLERNGDHGFSETGEMRIRLEEPPGCLAVSDDGLIFLGMTDHIEVFKRSGVRLDSWSYLGERATITSIALSGPDVFVADAGNHAVLRFSRSGELKGRIDGKDRSRPGFIIPSPYFDVACSGDGTVWIVNPGRHRIEAYMADGTSLDMWGTAARSIEAFQGCCNPSHIAIAQDGTFVTSEKGLPRVKIYTSKGAFRGLVADYRELKGVGKGLDVAVDESGRVYVVDPDLPGVRIFSKEEI